MRKDTAIETTMLNVKGFRIYVALERGNESLPPLLLINGIGANLEVFDPFIEALDNVEGQKIGTIRFDVPGIGKSPLPPHPLRLRGLTDLIADMLDALGHPIVDILGVSWGGGLAQEFAHQYPSRCRRLILVSTSTGGLSVPGKPSVLLKMLSPRRYLDPSYMVSIASTLYGDAFGQNPDLAQSYAQLISASHGLGYFGQLLATVGWTSLPWLHQIRQPTLILAGKDDVIVPPINARIMARLIPNATLHILNGGHLFALTEKEQVASLVHTFLRDDSKSGKRG